MASYLETTHIPLFHRSQYVTVGGCVTAADPYVQSRLSSEYRHSPKPCPTCGTDSTRSDCTPRPHLHKCRVGDRVRLNKKHRPFKKGYLPGWTEEVFVVTHVRRHPIVTYGLSEWSGRPIKGTFYEPDVQKVQVSDDSLFRVEKVWKRKGRNVLVRWKRWPAKYDSWIPAQPRHGTHNNNPSKKNAP